MLTNLENELLAAARLGLRFIENSESELGITLDSGDALRSAIANAEKEAVCCRGLAPIADCECAKNGE